MESNQQVPLLLLAKREDEEKRRRLVCGCGGGGGFSGELRKVSVMALPMVVVTVSQFLPQVVSTMMAGHLGELSLSGAAIATSFADVTGFSVLAATVGGGRGSSTLGEGGRRPGSVAGVRGKKG
ncbi:hypothetical protein TIFTF001_001974 [Ficus carica]|uniref:Uncharacterized protein n=1 Tax=Ficus carica TaxID=3494 RepID=A0AA88CSB0_FICCA|nr:hypothetical protein TIFTF001_001974 [Ficus carica]